MHIIILNILTISFSFLSIPLFVWDYVASCCLAQCDSDVSWCQKSPGSCQRSRGRSRLCRKEREAASWFLSMLLEVCWILLQLLREILCFHLPHHAALYTYTLIRSFGISTLVLGISKAMIYINNYKYLSTTLGRGLNSWSAGNDVEKITWYHW